jgi:hypothetical protein
MYVCMLTRIMAYRQLTCTKHAFAQSAQAKAILMSSRCMLTPCQDCLSNVAYAPESTTFSAKQATVTWATQKQSYIFGVYVKLDDEHSG